MKTEPETRSVPATHIATLVRGNCYLLRTGPNSFKTFNRGIAVEVTEIEKAQLEEHAVDAVTIVDPEEGISNRMTQKFEFEPIDTESTKPRAASKTKTKPRARASSKSRTAARA